MTARTPIADQYDEIPAHVLRIRNEETPRCPYGRLASLYARLRYSLACPPDCPYAQDWIGPEAAALPRQVANENRQVLRYAFNRYLVARRGLLASGE